VTTLIIMWERTKMRGVQGAHTSSPGTHAHTIPAAVTTAPSPSMTSYPKSRPKDSPPWATSSAAAFPLAPWAPVARPLAVLEAQPCPPSPLCPLYQEHSTVCSRLPGGTLTLKVCALATALGVVDGSSPHPIPHSSLLLSPTVWP
jgi:hypothetical protein